MRENRLPSLALLALPARCSREVLGDRSIEVDLFCSFDESGLIRIEPLAISYDPGDVEKMNPIHDEAFANGYFQVDREDFSSFLDQLVEVLPNYEAIEADAQLDLRDRFKTATLGFLDDVIVGSNLGLTFFIDSHENEMSFESGLTLCMESDDPAGVKFQTLLTAGISSVYE